MDESFNLSVVEIHDDCDSLEISAITVEDNSVDFGSENGKTLHSHTDLKTKVTQRRSGKSRKVRATTIQTITICSRSSIAWTIQAH